MDNTKNTLSEIVFILLSASFVIMIISIIKGLFIPDEFFNNSILWKASILPAIGSLIGAISLKNEVRNWVVWTTITTLVISIVAGMVIVNGVEPTFDRAIISVALFGLSNIILIFVDDSTEGL